MYDRHILCAMTNAATTAFAEAAKLPTAEQDTLLVTRLCSLVESLAVNLIGISTMFRPRDCHCIGYQARQVGEMRRMAEYRAGLTEELDPDKL